MVLVLRCLVGSSRGTAEMLIAWLTPPQFALSENGHARSLIDSYRLRSRTFRT
jgi:hypothetical protein